MAKANKQFHSDNAKMSFGNQYGSAIKNKMARSVDITGAVNNKIKVKSPPKSLA